MVGNKSSSVWSNALWGLDMKGEGEKCDFGGLWRLGKQGCRALTMIRSLSLWRRPLKTKLTTVNRSGRPRLILTLEGLASKTSHKQLFELALQSADEFAAKTIPEFQNAHNRHRSIGETMPVLGSLSIFQNVMGCFFFLTKLLNMIENA